MSENASSASMKDLIHFIAVNLVDQPDAVEVTEVDGGSEGQIIELMVAKEDLGKVIQCRITATNSEGTTEGVVSRRFEFGHGPRFVSAAFPSTPTPRSAT